LSALSSSPPMARAERRALRCRNGRLPRSRTDGQSDSEAVTTGPHRVYCQEIKILSKTRTVRHLQSHRGTPNPRVRRIGIPVVVRVEALEGHLLRLGFDDGREGSVDVAAVVGSFRGVFAPLSRPSYFRRVRVDSGLGTVCWPNGADIAPETLRDALSHVTRKKPVRGPTPSGTRPAPGTHGAMPETCRFFGVVIQIYFREKHAPHLHVRYGGKRASIDIRTLGISSGSLPPRVLGFVTEWAALHRRELMDNWARARRGQKLRPIAPLE